MGRGRNLKRRNLERPVFRHFEIVGIRMKGDE